MNKTDVSYPPVRHRINWLRSFGAGFIGSSLIQALSAHPHIAGLFLALGLVLFNRNDTCAECRHRRWFYDDGVVGQDKDS